MSGVLRSTEVAPGLRILRGAVNTGLLVAGDEAVLFDCCDSVTPDALKEFGVSKVHAVLCTQHRRPNAAGVYAWADAGVPIVVPAVEAPLFEGAEAHWESWVNRRHLYHFQPGPLVPLRSVPVSRAVCEGDQIDWAGPTVYVFDAPGATDGAVAYVVKVDGKDYAFCGDLLYGPGRILDLYSLQKGHAPLTDYHGFLGNREILVDSLSRLIDSGVDVLLPSHGDPISNPAEALALFDERLDKLVRNYAAISAMNHYFPSQFENLRDDPLRMQPGPRLDFPPHVRRVAYTSHALISESGAALVMDCGHDSVVTKLEEWIRDGIIETVEGCWVTHYHDDHVDSLHRIANQFKCPIFTERHLTDVIEHPDRFHIPCISPNAMPVAKAFRHGESWQWHEFTLTALHFPGQTLYHGGLLAEGHGVKVLFAGDSGAPTGLDDYTAGNRTFLREGSGFRRCIELWREHRPDYTLNSHQDKAFAFTHAQLDHMERLLAERRQIVAEMTPWSDADFALDEWWIRVYPFEQAAAASSEIAVDVQFTNHGPMEAEARVEPVLPNGWTIRPCDLTVRVGAQSDGVVDPDSPTSDGKIRLWLRVPVGARPGWHTVPVRVTWDGHYLGQLRHAMIEVW